MAAATAEHASQREHGQPGGRLTRRRSPVERDAEQGETRDRHRHGDAIVRYERHLRRAVGEAAPGPRSRRPRPPARARAARARARRRRSPSRRARRRTRRARRRCRKSSRSDAERAGAERAAAAGDAAPCWATQPQLSAHAEASASASPGRTVPASPPRALERQVGLGGERRDADPRQVEAPLVDDEAPLPAREELAVEREQVVELEVALEPQQRAPLQLLQRPTARPPARAARRTARSSATRARSRARAPTRSRSQISHSLNPFGVVRSRGIDESESAAPAREIAKCRKPPARPSGPKPTTNTAWSSPSAKSASSAITKPRSGCVAAPGVGDRLELAPQLRVDLARPQDARRSRRARAGGPTGAPCGSRGRRARTRRCRRSPRRRGRARAARARR